MDKKYVITGITSGVVCLMMGLLFGYIAGANMIPGMQLSGADMGGGSVQSMGNGQFSVNGQTMDFDTLMMSLQMERAGQIDSQLEAQMEAVQKRNETLKEANEHLTTLREYQYAGRSSAPEAAVVTFFEEQGIPYPTGDIDGAYTTQDWRDMIDSLKDYIDSVNSGNQLDMIRLQSLMSKRNQSFEMMSNIMKKQQDTMNSTIRNMR